VTTRRELDRIAQRAERQMFLIFQQVLDDIRDNVRLSQLIDLIERGRIDDVIEALRLDPVSWQPYYETIRDAYRTGGEMGASQLGRIPTDSGLFVARFDLRNPRAESWLTEKSSTMIVEVVQAQRDMVRTVLTGAMAAGMNPRTSALDLIGRVNQATGKREGGFIGLTNAQSQWVANARERLDNLDEGYFGLKLRDRRFDKTIASHMADGTPIPQSVIDNAITRYQARAERYRGQVISRTESINALRAGQWEAIEQAVEDAEIQPSEARKRWDATLDGRTRDDHEMMHGEEVGVDELFTLPDGSQGMYPGDPALPAEQSIQCRCWVDYTIDFGARLKRVEGFR
jgi:hypothetical protein